MPSSELRQIKLPPKIEKGIPLPEDTGEEMVITRGTEAQDEFDPTKKAKAGTAYSGEPVAGLVSAEKSYETANKDRQTMESKAKAYEKKYLAEMATFFDRKDKSSSQKIEALNRFLAYTNRQLENTLIQNDELAKKRYEKVQKQAEYYLEQLTREKAA